MPAPDIPVQPGHPFPLGATVQRGGVLGEDGADGAEGVLIRSPLSRQDLAAMVGATPETVSRVMADLKREGLIDTGRQWVRVLDPRGLQALDT